MENGNVYFHLFKNLSHGRVNETPTPMACEHEFCILTEAIWLGVCCMKYVRLSCHSATVTRPPLPPQKFLTSTENGNAWLDSTILSTYPGIPFLNNTSIFLSSIYLLPSYFWGLPSSHLFLPVLIHPEMQSCACILNCMILKALL